MKIDFKVFLEHLITNFVSDSIKLRKYTEKTLDVDSFKEFVDYLDNNDSNSYNTFKEAVITCYIQYDCGVAISKAKDIFDFALDELRLPILINIIFSHQCLIDSFNNYLKENPVKTLLQIPYFCEAISQSIIGCLDNAHGIVYFDCRTNSPTFCLNTHLEKSSIKINQGFLKESLTYLSDIYDSSEYLFDISIDNNIITITYGNNSVKGMLIDSANITNLLKSFSFKSNDEKSLILNAFFNMQIPYEFVVLYFSTLFEYIDYNTEEPFKWVLDKFNQIKNNEYFYKLSQDYSICFTVFVHSIYPGGDICELIEKDFALSNPYSKDYSTFSFLNWLYNKKNCV